jgi:hypothetical protein
MPCSNRKRPACATTPRAGLKAAPNSTTARPLRELLGRVPDLGGYACGSYTTPPKEGTHERTDAWPTFRRTHRRARTSLSHHCWGLLGCVRPTICRGPESPARNGKSRERPSHAGQAANHCCASRFSEEVGSSGCITRLLGLWALALGFVGGHGWRTGGVDQLGPDTEPVPWPQVPSSNFIGALTLYRWRKVGRNRPDTVCHLG